MINRKQEEGESLIPSIRLGVLSVFIGLVWVGLDPSCAWAKVGLSPGAIDANSLEAAAGDCMAVCNHLFYGNERKNSVDEWNKETADSQFKVRWTPADDQWCADHGSPTNEAVSAKNVVITPSPSASPYAAQNCPYPTYPGESCSEVKNRLMRCKLKNSQIESQCAAYFQAKDGIKWQWTLVVLDTAAAASCLGACYLGDTMNPALSKACTGAGAAATGTEAFAALKMKNSTFMKIITGATAAGGGTMLVRKAISTAPAPSTEKGKANTPQDNERQSACIAGYFFTALAGIRGYSIYDATQSEESACQSIQDLASKSATVGASGAQLTQSDYTFRSGAGAGTLVTQGAGSGTSSSKTSTPPTTEGVLDPTTGKVVGQAALSGDGSILNKTDLGKLSLPKARQINPNELMSSLQKDPGRAVGQGIIAMSGGLLPSSALQSAGGVIQDIRNNRKAYARDLLGGGNAAIYASEGGGGHPAEAPTDGGAGEIAAALSGLFGGPPEGGEKAPASQEIIFPGHDSGDIWHSQAQQTSIFDIISSRIRKTSHRMEN